MIRIFAIDPKTKEEHEITDNLYYFEEQGHMSFEYSDEEFRLEIKVGDTTEIYYIEAGGRVRKLDTQWYEVPLQCPQSAMRHHWWVAYCWENVTTTEDTEPIYLRGIPRPIEEVQKASDDFHMMRQYRLAVQGETE